MDKNYLQYEVDSLLLEILRGDYYPYEKKLEKYGIEEGLLNLQNDVKQFRVFYKGEKSQINRLPYVLDELIAHAMVLKHFIEMNPSSKIYPPYSERQKERPE